VKGWKTTSSVGMIPCHSLDKKQSIGRGCHLTENGMGRNPIPETLSIFLNTRSRQTAEPCKRRYNVRLPLSEPLRTDSGKASLQDAADGISNKLLDVTNRLIKKNLQRQLQFIMKPYFSTLKGHHQNLVLFRFTRSI